jgi:acetyl esterase
MSVHPALLPVLEAAAKGNTAFDTDDVAEARRRYAASTAAYAPERPIACLTRDANAGDIPMRLYRAPGAAGPLPCVAFFHGGGWVLGDIETHDNVCRALAVASGCMVASVRYRLAPEHRFPAAVDDAVAAIAWLAGNATAIQGDGRIAVAGDSAGGNLAAAATQLIRDGGGPGIAAQVLIYPATDFSRETDSMRAFGKGHLLTADAIAFCRDSYLTDEADRRDPRASPLLAGRFDGLPPALVQTAAYDPLRDEGRAYAEALSRAGVLVTYTCYPGMLHGFARMQRLVPEATEATAEAAFFLRRRFGMA